MIVSIVFFNFFFPVQRLPKALKDLEELREFYDPDTVELMTWIK